MQRLTPLLLGYERYMVKPGDTYYRIATARGTSVRAMLTANPNQNPNLLIPGQYLNVPYGFPVVPADVPFSSELRAGTSRALSVPVTEMHCPDGVGQTRHGVAHRAGAALRAL